MEVWGGNTAVNKWFEMPGLNTWVFSQPHGQSAGGGDVYYLSSCASGRITRVLLADVSGHGSKVSEIAVGLRELMRTYVNLIHQSKFVQAVNREFTDAGHAGKFATAIVGTYFAPTRSYEFCIAGHPPPFLYRAETRTWSIPVMRSRDQGGSPPNIPFGIDAATVYSQYSIRLAPGDAVLGYSDALIESERAEGGLLLTEGLLEVVRSVDFQCLETFVAELVRSIRNLNPRNLAGDDATIIVCQATQSGTTLKDNLLAPIRLLRRATDNTTLAACTRPPATPE